MGIFDTINKFLKSQPPKPNVGTVNGISTIVNITYNDLHIIKGMSHSLNKEKLEWCLSQGMDNEAIREAVREKEMIDKISVAEGVKVDQNEALYQRTSAESKKFKILRSDDPKIKQEKREKREKLWEDYHKQKAKNEEKKNSAATNAYGENFFADLAANKEMIGWEWSLSSRGDACDICKKNAGRYLKGQGPKYPVHEGCICNLSAIMDGETI